MRHCKLVCLFVCLFMAGVFSGNNPAFCDEKVINISFNYIHPATHRLTLLQTEWGKEVERRSNGRIKVTVFPGNQLLAADKCYDGVAKGIADMGMSVLGYTRGKFPLTEVIDLPLGFTSGAQATRVMSNFYKKFKPKEFDEVKVLYLNGHGPGLLHTRTPVSNLEELKGMKIRCHGLSAKMVQRLGGVPVGMPVTDAYDALSKGIVEGILLPFEAMEGFRIGEVVKYTTECYGISYTSAMFVAMNKKKFDSLPADLQKIIEDVSEEYIPKVGETWSGYDKSGKEFILNRGNKVIPLTKEENERWAKAVRPIIDDYLEATKKKGLPGEEALKFVLDEMKKPQ